MGKLTKQQKTLIASKSEENRNYFLKNKEMILEAYGGPTVIYKRKGGGHMIISSENEGVLRNTLKTLDVVARESAYWVTEKDRIIDPDPF